MCIRDRSHSSTVFTVGSRAIWRNADHDQPVVLSVLLGEQNGVRYWGLEGSSTGVPEHELAPDMLGELGALLADGKVEAADAMTAAKVQAVIDLVATHQGIARQAGLEALTRLIGYLPAEERQRLKLGKLCPREVDAAAFLAQCPPPPGAPKFVPMSLAELIAMPPKRYLIDQIMGAGDLCMLYGPSGTGKTFVAIDMLLSACLGRRWAMRFDVERPLTIAYTAGEGLAGLPQRFAAAAEYYGVSEIPSSKLSFYAATPQLFATSDMGEFAEATVGDFVRDWRQRQAAGGAGQLDLLVVDTLHAATVGADENSAQDMGRVLQAVKAARSALGCAVLLVHHTGKNGDSERGSSAMRGAMDAMFAVKPTAGKFSLECTKLKDGEQWKAQTFDLVAAGENSVRVWWDEPTDGQSTGAKAADKERLVAELQRYTGKRFTSKSLAEVLGKTDNYTRNLLVEIERAGDCKRALQDAGKQPSSRNPWVYFVGAAAVVSGVEDHDS